MRTTMMVASLLMLAGSAVALEPPAVCSDPAHRQFDFWLGHWEVRRPDGKVAGVNHIERDYGGCVIHERYTAGSGYRGESLNVYDAGRKVWHQTWVDSDGLLLLIEGRFADGRMTLEGQTKGADGKTTRHRISWTPNPDGTVRQLWESTDAAGRWSVAFDGKYVRK